MGTTLPDRPPTIPSRAWAQFDLAALRSNLTEIKRRVGREVELIASVKADAYGHGAVPIARELESAGVFTLATGSLAEAVQIRRAGVSVPILLFPGFRANAVPAILEHALSPGIDQLELAQQLSSSATMPVSVWIKVDAGLGRHGVPLEDAAAFADTLRDLPRIDLAGVFTHLPFVDERGRRWAGARVAAFASVLHSLEARGHRVAQTQALSSVGALAGLDDPSTAICPGHALYGIAPATEEVMSTDGLEPVARSIASVLTHVAPNPLARSTGIGGARELPAGAVTGVVSLGRRDGYRWHNEQPAAMLVRGQRAPVIGLSLEHVMLDLTQIPASVGEEVVVFGQQGDASITLVELAAWRRSTPVETLLDFAGEITPHYLDALADSQS